MSVTIKFDAASAAAKIQGATERTLKSMQKEIIDGCNEFCPERDGELKKSAVTHSNVVSDNSGSTLNIVYSTPYARAMYYGVQMVDPDTLAAGFLNKDKEWRSRRDIKKIPHPEKKEYEYSKEKNEKAQKLWCEKAFQEYGEIWERMLNEKIREELK